MKQSHKLTDEQKIELVEKYKTQQYTYADLARFYSIEDCSVIELLSNRNIPKNHKKYKKYTFNINYFDIIDTEEKAYFLGLLYADGCNIEKHNKIEISLIEEDRLILEKFNLELNSNTILSFRNYKKKNINWSNQYKLSLVDEHFSKQLSKLGCFQKKSLTLKFPTEEQVPSNLVRHFVRGYFDGDGCITYSRNKFGSKNYACSIVSTLDFCTSTQSFIKNEIDINLGIYYTNKNNLITKRLLIGGNKQVKTFLNWLYKDASIYLDRKYQKYQSSLQN